jgi:hypothetical protein
MISEIRVKARAASMEEAEREIGILLDHARMAGFLEGFVPQSSREKDDDNHFSIVRRGDGWNRLGLMYEGRVVLAFEPERIVGGGLAQYGFDVIPKPVGPDEVAVFPPHEGQGFMVLDRKVPVTREHSWEGSSEYGYNESGISTSDGDTPRLIEPGSDEHLATFNRTRHHLHGDYIAQVWLRGVTEGILADKPTNVYGTVNRWYGEEEHTRNEPPLFEYTQDVEPGQTVEEIVEAVDEKISLWADAYVRAKAD